MHVSRTINASSEKLWNILTDTLQWSVWGPSVSAVECPHQFISKGVQGRLKTAIGVWVTFEITRFEPLVYWHWKVAGIPASGHRLKELGPERCELIFEMPAVAFPYALICRQAANRIALLASNAGRIEKKG